MTELVFLAEEDVDGGFVAQAIGPTIVTQAETLEELRHNIREGVECRFGKAEGRPRAIRLERRHG